MAAVKTCIKKYPRREKRCRRVMWPAFVYFILMFIVLITYSIIPIYIFYSTNQTMESRDKGLPYLMIFPFDVQKSINYVATYIFGIVSGYIVISNFYAHDALLLLCVSYSCGQFEMLHGDLVRLIPECHAEWKERYGAGTSSVNFNITADARCIKILQDMYTKRLHDLCARHNTLIGFCEQLNDLISFPLLANLVSSTLSICFCGFQFLITGTTSIGDFMLFSSFFLSSTLQLFMICSCGAMLITYSADTTFYAYTCNWEGGQLSENSALLHKPQDMYVDQLNKKLPLWKSIKYYPADKDFCNKLRFMITRSQRPIELNAMKFTIISLESFTKILSSSMSYFALLKSFLEEQT